MQRERRKKKIGTRAHEADPTLVSLIVHEATLDTYNFILPLSILYSHYLQWVLHLCGMTQTFMSKGSELSMT